MATDSNQGAHLGSPYYYYLSNRQRLQKAAMEGDWKEAEEIFRSHANLATAVLGTTGMTALHIASKCGKSAFVVKLVARLDPSDLMMHDQLGRTALHYAATTASVEAATAMVNKWPESPNQVDADGYTPLFYAANWRHPSKAKEMVEYLYGLANGDYVYTSDITRASNLIVAITASGCHGIALEGLKRNPELAITRNESGWSILHVLVYQPSLLLKSSTNKWSRACIISWMMNILCQRPRQIDEYSKDSIELIHVVCEHLQKEGHHVALNYFKKSDYLDPILHTATKNGVHELVIICLSYFPELIWYPLGNDEKLLLHMAVEYRQEEIFDHIMDLAGGSMTMETYSQTQADGEARENILHLAAKLAPANQPHLVLGPAFQMQKELQWFKAVEELVYKDEKVAQNEKGMIPMALFFEEHKDLIKEAKEWLKDTSNSCMVIATLVATVAFASMITVPGGTNDSTGLPIFSNRVQFVIFSVSNAISMISSAISLFVFLSIQTSRYSADQDSMVSLPKNLLTGLFALFVAVATLMIAFALAIGMAMLTGVNLAYIPIIIAACIPALIVTRLQLIPLLLHTLTITTRPGISSAKKNMILWCLNKPIANRRLIKLRRTHTDSGFKELSEVVVTP